MTDNELICLLWNKCVRIGLLRSSFMQVEIWDGDIDYGLEWYNEGVSPYDVLTKEEYINIYNYIREHKKK